MATFPSLPTSVLPQTTGLPLPLSTILWVVIVGFFISFVLSVAIGANDVANSFGTSVGAKVLTLRQALVLATIFETLGAVLMGSKVAATIQKGIFDVGLYEGREETLVVGEMSALAACAVWLFAATALKMPVSTTHSIVGASLGFHLVVFATKGIRWLQIGLIAVSWVTSPVLSGLCSTLIFVIMKHSVINKDEPLEPGLRLLPFWYALVIVINFFSIFYEGPEALGFDRIPLWAIFVISFGSGFLAGVVVWFLFVPRFRRGIKETAFDEKHAIYDKKETYGSHGNEDGVHLIGGAQDVPGIEATRETGLDKMVGVNEEGRFADSINPKQTEASAGQDGADTASEKTVKDHPHVKALCSPLQAVSAVFASFAHGGNDVSNAVGPLIAIWLVYQTGEVTQGETIPLWVLFYGAMGISLGLWALGRRVIQTVGEDITALTPSTGFSVELGAATTVLVASNVGIPVSTTHCKIGSVVAVGWVRSRQAVNWSLFRSIVLAWVVTLPVTTGLSAAIMALAQIALEL